jgi:hypothetical protein
MFFSRPRMARVRREWPHETIQRPVTMEKVGRLSKPTTRSVQRSPEPHKANGDTSVRSALMLYRSPPSDDRHRALAALIATHDGAPKTITVRSLRTPLHGSDTGTRASGNADDASFQQTGVPIWEARAKLAGVENASLAALDPATTSATSSFSLQFPPPSGALSSLLGAPESTPDASRFRISSASGNDLKLAIGEFCVAVLPRRSTQSVTSVRRESCC